MGFRLLVLGLALCVLVLPGPLSARESAGCLALPLSWGVATEGTPMPAGDQPPLLREWSEDTGDPAIRDDHTGFTDRGIRPYQDLVDVDFDAKRFDTGVNVVYGNLIHRRTDFHTPGRGLPLRLAFTYNSGSFFDGRLGYGWQMNYGVRYVTNSENGNILIVRPDDRTDIFLAQPGGSFQATYGVRDSLIALPQGYRLIVWNDTDNGNGDYAVYYFDSPNHHYVTRIEDRNGNALVFTYDAALRLTQVTDACGRILTLVYDALRLRSAIDPAGRQVHYGYDPLGNLSTVTDALGATVTYAYDALCHDLLSITNPRGQTYQFTYHPDYAVATVASPLGGIAFTFAYNWPLRVTTVTDGNGHTSTYTYDGLDRVIAVVDPLGNTESRTWDPVYNLAARTDPNGNPTAFTYDFRGNRLTATDPSGNVFSQTWSYPYNKPATFTDANGGTTIFSYDTRGNLTQVADPLGHMTTLGYDPYGQVINEIDALGATTTYIYDPCGNHINTLDALGFSWTYGYDPAGNCTSVTDANGNATTYLYDALNRLVVVTDALGYQETHTYDPVGNLTARTDGNGFTTVLTYDGLNRLIAVTDPLTHTESYGYDPVGTLVSVTDRNGYATTYGYDSANRRIASYCPIGCVTRYSYDPVGNRISKTDANGNTWGYGYDSQNRQVSTTDAMGATIGYSYDPVGNRISETDRNGNATTYGYDALNRLIAVTDGAGGTTTYTYDAVANRIGEVGANGAGTVYAYDLCRRLTSITDGLGAVTSYTRDPVGSIVTATDANGNTTAYGYDAVDALILVTSPLGAETRFTRDGVGQVAQRIDPNLASTSYAYDALGRRTATNYPIGRMERSYDAVGNVLQLQNIGIGLNDQTSRSYDAMNRLVSETINYGPFAKTVQYGYDPTGNLLALADPDGLVIHYTYDAADRVTDIVGQDGGRTTFTYDMGGRNQEMHFQDGTYSQYDYDAADRRIGIETRDAWDIVLYGYDYTYDAAGLVLSVVKSGIAEASYLYDGANRLSTASYATGQDYLYTLDPVGNRLSQDDHGMITTYAYNAENRIIDQYLPGGSSITYNHDANSSVTSTASAWGAVDYVYDHENRLTQIDYPAPCGTVRNFFSPEGQRLAREEQGLMTFYFPTLRGVVAEMDGIGNTIVRINPSITLMQSRQDTQVHWDALGGTTYFTEGEVTASFQFGYFGEMLAYSDDPETVDSGLYASCMKVDWDPMLGAELIAGDYSPDVDQRYGGAWQDLPRIDTGPGPREATSVIAELSPWIRTSPLACCAPQAYPDPTAPGPFEPPKPARPWACVGPCTGTSKDEWMIGAGVGSKPPQPRLFLALLKGSAKAKADDQCVERADMKECLCNGTFDPEPKFNVEFVVYRDEKNYARTAYKVTAEATYQGTCQRN